MTGTIFKSLLVCFLAFTAGCDEKKESGAKSTKDWLSSGSIDERISLVSKHLRGFDMAMVETGYRYVELYWAGQDKNWEYADYQLGKIRIAISNGIERRPGRAKSAKIIYPVLDQLSGTIKEHNLVKFKKDFRTLTQTCNACHSEEGVGFFKVDFPLQRLSPISNATSNSTNRRAGK